jgi:hypothetical protein
VLPFDGVARIDTGLDSRSISFENPTGERGAGGKAAKGRKGSPSKMIAAGEKVVLADIQGPGRIRHIWMTFPPARPEDMRAVWMEVFYDGENEPSISVPCLDFFGLPHGRTSPYHSALTSVQEGRGFNAYYPIPFSRSVRIELTNSSPVPLIFYYQIDYTLEAPDHADGYLHVLFNRENPTTRKKDFVIASGLKGPGRFLGCAIGIRVFQDGMFWYGEGEIKIYRDGDVDYPTICGTGLEDYVGSAWGMGQHAGLYAGVPINVARPPGKNDPQPARPPMPDFVGFYRWHLADPIIFHDSFRMTIQQIGSVSGKAHQGGRERLSKFEPAGNGWITAGPQAKGTRYEDFIGGIAERQDDYSAAAFLYLSNVQSVPRLNVASATSDIRLKDYEAVPELPI